jgi:catechol 2,3-dioxygenase-like lactoylglutathione lyase family enzyme
VIDAQITFLPVADLERSDAFYRGVLGLDLVLDQGSCHIYGVAGGAYLGVCAREETGSGGTMVTLVVADVDAWCRDAEARGADFAVTPRNNPTYGIRQAFLRDPDGHLIEVQTFDDPTWGRAGR